MKQRSVMIAVVLLASALAPLIPLARAIDFPVTSTSRSDFVYSGNNYGSAVSESKISADPAYQSQSAVYGPNNPIMYAGLMAELANSNIPFFLYSLKVTVRITNSAGQTLQPINVGDLGMNISPNDSSSTTDWGQIFGELYNYVTSVIGLPQFPSLQNPAPVNTSGCQSSTTGVGCDSSTVWAQWTWPGPSLVYEKAINFRFQPNFPIPDIYSIGVSTEADMYIITSSGHIGFVTAATSSYSFQYVYESDANSGNDAGKTFSTATGISLGTYGGLMYGADTADMYKFDGTQGQTIYYNLVPPQSADFGITFYNSTWSPISGAGGDPGTGNPLYGSFTPPTTGSYYEKIYLTSGSGTYSFSLSLSSDFTFSANPSSLTISSGCPTTRITFTSIGYSGAISTWSGPPNPGPGPVYSFIANSTTPPFTSTVTLSIGSSATELLQIWANNGFTGPYTVQVGTKTTSGTIRVLNVPVSFTSGYTQCGMGGGGSGGGGKHE